MVPSGEYFEGEEGRGCTPSGCALTLGVLALVAFGLFVAPNLANKQGMKQLPRKETRNYVDTNYRIADTMRVYKVR